MFLGACNALHGCSPEHSALQIKIQVAALQTLSFYPGTELCACNTAGCIACRRARQVPGKWHLMLGSIHPPRWRQSQVHPNHAAFRPGDGHLPHTILSLSPDWLRQPLQAACPAGSDCKEVILRVKASCTLVPDLAGQRFDQTGI